MFDKNYILSRLAAGDSIQTIGDQFAAMLNEAMAEHTASQEQTKTEKVKQIKIMIDAVLKYAALCGLEVDEIEEPTDEDITQAVELMDEMVQELKKAKQMKDRMSKIIPIQPAVGKKAQADEEIFNAFLASLANSSHPNA